MAYVPGYEYDLFISYSHDDDFAFGQGAGGGWVTDFHNGLEARLKQILGARSAEVWLDKKRLSGEWALDDKIRQDLGGTAAFLAIVSPLYLTSNYCRDEREWFLEHAAEALRVGAMSRALRVVKTPDEDNAHRRVFADTLGFELFESSAEGFSELAMTSPEFRTRMEQLCQGLARLLKSMWRASTPVYVATVPRELLAQRRQLVEELTAQGFRVLPRIEIDSANVNQVADEGIAEAELSVHLFGAEDDELSIQQAALAMGRERTMVTWALEAGMTQRKDEYGEFLRSLLAYQDPQKRSQFLDRTRVERVKAEVLGLLRPFEAPPAPAAAGKRRVYLVADRRTPEDFRDIWKIRTWMREKDKLEVELPETAPLDPGELRADHERKLASSDGLLLYWNQASEGWFEATKADLDRREYLSEAIGVGKLGFEEPGRVVLPLVGDFDYQALDPFLKPLRS
jgi:hypothetical protein